MLRPASPCASSSSMAAPTIWSRLNEDGCPRRDRGGRTHTDDAIGPVLRGIGRPSKAGGSSPRLTPLVRCARSLVQCTDSLAHRTNGGPLPSPLPPNPPPPPG